MISTGEFRRRARFEAARYGADPWVFVRELIQNARDAGASRIELEAERRDGRDRVLCRDDGCGMSFEHARRYLFTLYASSKTTAEDAAGRFGIGFWSVLRFGPREVVVRSAPDRGRAWQVRLSGDLELVEVGPSSLERGTEVELVRPASDGDPDEAVWQAVVRDARYLRRRAAGDEPVAVVVNGRLATAELDLAPPSLGFSRPGFRGAVALGDVPRVDLLAHGLRVRTAATLDELLTEPAASRRRRPPTLPEGLVPQVVLDSRRLRVLMARGDARSDGELRRLVAAGHRALRRLVRHELDRGCGLGPTGRVAMRLREALAWRPKAAVASVLAVLGLAAAAVLMIEAPEPPGITRERPGLSIAADPAPESVLAGDLAERYRGPVSGAAERPPGRVALRYRPIAAEPMLAVFRVDGVDARGRVRRLPPDPAGGAFRGIDCRTGCLEIHLDLVAGPGSVRLPVPTGHGLDPRSLRLDRTAAELRTAADGGPLLVLETVYRGWVRYRTGPTVEAGVPPTAGWPALPVEAAAFADSLQPLAPEEAAERAAEWVRGRVAYDASPQTARRHREADAAGLGFAERCLAVAAGDCDIQSVLAAAVLARAGVPVRLAVGWVGSAGRAVPGLHAWVEFLGRDGVWRAEDVTAGGAGGSSAAALGVEAPSPEPASETSEKTSPVAAGGPRLVRRVLPVVLWLGLATAAVAAVVAAARGTRLNHRHRPGESTDLAGLVNGALARPEAYAEVPALFERRIVPSLGGEPMSLRRARRLARRGVLAVATRPGELARRAAESGCGVVDGSRPEGRVAASALGAVDLDRWQRLVAIGRRPPECRRLEEAATEAGECWRVVVVADAPDEVSILDGRVAGKGRVVVALNARSTAWSSVTDAAADRPAAAALMLAETVLDILEWPTWRRRPILERLAQNAVDEAAEVEP